MVSLSEFYDMLEKHDWYYAWSDDGRVYNAGSASYNKLCKIAEGKLDYQYLLNRYTDHMFTGKPWKTEQVPKPERPKP